MRAYHFLSARYALAAIEKQRLKVSRFDDLNDPFELYAAELQNPKHRIAFRKFKKEMAKRFGLLCFSKSWKSPLLWSHYGDRHKGVALEFDINEDIINEVSYKPDRLLLNIGNKLSSGGLVNFLVAGWTRMIWIAFLRQNSSNGNMKKRCVFS